MEFKQALVLWCEFPDEFRRTDKATKRIKEYLSQKKPVFYAPMASYSESRMYPLDEIIVIRTAPTGLNDSYIQQNMIIKELKSQKIDSIEIGGPGKDICFESLIESFEIEGIKSEINHTISGTLLELHYALKFIHQ